MSHKCRQGSSEMKFISRMSCEIASLCSVSLTWEAQKEVSLFVSFQPEAFVKVFLPNSTMNAPLFLTTLSPQTLIEIM